MPELVGKKSHTHTFLRTCQFSICEGIWFVWRGIRCVMVSRWCDSSVPRRRLQAGSMNELHGRIASKSLLSVPRFLKAIWPFCPRPLPYWQELLALSSTDSSPVFSEV